MKFSAEQVFDSSRTFGTFMMKPIRIEMRRGGFIEGVFMGRYTHPKGKVYLRIGCGYPETEAIQDWDVADGASVEFF